MLIPQIPRRGETGTAVLRPFRAIMAAAAVGLATAPALANHPGADRLDAVLAEKETAFEAVDSYDFPDLDLITADGREVSLDTLSDQILVLSFAPAECGAPCEAQQRTLDEVRAGIDATPMRDMVTFVTVRPAGQGSAAPPPGHRLSASPNSTSVAGAAAAFAALSGRDAAEPRAHIIDRAARHAAIFHGAEFEPLNMVLYINGLSNEAPRPRPGLLDRVMGLFR